MPPAERTNADAVRFGAIVRRLRKERGWTQDRLARRANLNPSYLSILERGGNTPSLTIILELAEVLGASAADMVRELEEARRPTPL
jgi:transcriptional regulator with XRE-family HTH domain